MRANNNNFKYLRNKLKKIFTKQFDQADCGVACLSTIIKYHDGFIPLEKLRELSGTSKQGTTLLGLYQAAQSVGFDVQGLEAESIENLRELDNPVILHVILQGSLQHYFVFLGFDEKDNAIIADPAKGVISLSRSELSEFWKSKSLLKMTPNKNFIKTKQFKVDKWNWFKTLIEEDFNILLVALILGVIMAVLGISTAIFSQRLIDKVLPEGNLSKLIVSLILVTILLIIRAALNYLRGNIINRQNRGFNNRVTVKFYKSLINLPKSFFDTRKIGDLIARMNDTRRIQSTINSIIGNFIIDILVIVISLAAVFLYSVTTGYLICLSFILFFLIVYKFHRLIVRSQKEVMQTYALSESNFIDTMQGVETIKVNNKESFFVDLTKEIYGLFQLRIFNLGNVNIKYGFWSELAGVVLLLGIFAITSYQVLNKELLIGEMVAILSLASSIVPSINRIAVFNIQIQEAKIAFDRMYEFSSLKPESVKEENNLDINGFHHLEVKSICFRFTGRKLLLINVSLQVKKGELIAVLGESGIGKSTLIQILQKFYMPESGEILVDNVNISTISTPSWRNLIGVVPQQVKIFNGTLLYNICLGDSVKEYESVVNFCKSYGFDSYFSTFPQSYFTIIGEEGINISGGQQQLVALARALYKKPQMLILDEATSAMDRNTENFTLNLLQNLRSELAVILITHRIKTASRVDKIYILEDGTIIDYGTPKELMSTNNFYSLSFKEQVENG